MASATETGLVSDGDGAGMSADMQAVESRPDPIKNRRDFLRASRAQSVATPGFVLQARKRAASEAAAPGGAPEAVARLGLTASKKVGNAVVRNRAKRRLRALAWDVIARIGRPGWDYVLVARVGETVSRHFATMARELESALQRAHDGKGRRQPPRGKGGRSPGGQGSGGRGKGDRGKGGGPTRPARPPENDGSS